MTLQLKVTASNDDADYARTGSALRTAATHDFEGVASDIPDRLAPLLNNEAQRVVAFSAAAAAASRKADVATDEATNADAANPSEKAKDEEKPPKQLVFRVFGRAAGRSFPLIQLGEFSCRTGDEVSPASAADGVTDCVARQREKEREVQAQAEAAAALAPANGKGNENGSSGDSTTASAVYVVCSLSGAAQECAEAQTSRQSALDALRESVAAGGKAPTASRYPEHQIREIMKWVGTREDAISTLDDYGGDYDEALERVSLSLFD
jgi:hypothetical protein